MGEIMVESILRWRLNGSEQPPMLCSPGEEKELLTGYLLTSQLVKDPSSVHAVKDPEGVWQVTAAAEADPPRGLVERIARIAPCGSGMKTKLAHVRELMDRLTELGNSGGRHAALLAAGGEVVIGRDVGRHNALDKAVGRMAETGLPLTEAVYCTSGRLSIEILSKAAAAGIPVLCTRKQVGNLALMYAELWNMAIVQMGEPVRICGAAWRVEEQDR